MWLLFGAITLACACLYAGRKRYAATWNGTPYPVRDAVFLASLESNAWGSRPSIGLATPSTLEFECKAESWLDRFFKWTGLAVELQLGQDRFDRAVYLIADNRAVLDVLQREPDFCERLIDLFQKPVHPDFRVHRVVCRRGKFWIEFRKTAVGADQFGLLARAAPIVRRMWAALPDRLPEAADGKDRLFLRTVIVLAFSTGLAINGVGHLYRLLFFDGVQTLDRVALLTVGAMAGAILLAMQFLLATVLLARSSRLHLVMLELLLVGSFGALSTGIVEVRDLNIDLDGGEATPYATTVLDLTVSRSRRSSTRHYARVASWDNEPEGRLRVSYDDYHALTIGEPATIYVREGYFGIRWIQGVRPGAPTPSDAR